MRELSNLQSALDWSFSCEGDLEIGVRLAGALRWWFFARMGQLAQAKKWLDIALERRHELSPSLQLKAMTAAMSIAYSLGDYSRTAGIGGEAVALAENLGDRVELATALMSRGGAAVYEGDLPRARQCLERSLQYCLELGDRWGTAFVLGFSGVASRRSGDNELARAQLEEALSIFRDLRDDHNQVAPMLQLALLAERAGNFDEAMRQCDEAGGLARRLGDGQLAHGATCVAGRVELSRGNHEDARRLLIAGLQSYPGVEHQLMVAIAVEGLAIIAHLENCPSRAVELWGFAQHLRQVSAMPLTQERLLEQGRYLAQASAQIGPDAVRRGLASGSRLSLGEVLVRAGRRAGRRAGSVGSAPP
ncbi:MAG: hypothetical protein M3083_22970 [Actinomycetota bacterium]|nr:hypothetical protein [Actinomycetota bacterium]